MESPAAHVLAGQGKELTRGCRPDLAERLEQPFHDGPKHFVHLEVQRRLGQARVAPVQKRGAQLVQPADGPVQQCPDDRLGRRIAGQLIQVALDHNGGVFFTHGAAHPPEGGCRGAESRRRHVRL